ncbi:VWA domain-containing protein [Conexibacter sp. SYSU D00693]|uniref:VWA domain-containing protein n=1 Tax=Conexibacter sp. SYSU D00693 TaxID=2812560 RepID=UPI00196A449D|nr:VWA domain-containing protein [Conexibacter sp. SYSU D00693]
MSFASPLWLLALLAVPALGWLSVVAARRRRRFAVRFPAAGLLVAVAGRQPAWRRRAPGALVLAGIAALALALARPQATVAVPVEQASILLVTDTSRSMLADDVSPSRLAAAQAAARDFVSDVPDTVRVGLVSYSDAAAVTQAPTTDRAALGAAIDGLAADGGTATGEALRLAVDTLRPSGSRARVPSAVVLLSDGATTVGRDPVGVARAARAAGVPVYTVALGTESGTIDSPDGRGPVLVPPDPETLARIAETSGGEAFSAQDADALHGVYERLGSRLGRKRERREITAGFAAGGLLLLGSGVVAGIRRRPALA